MTPHVVVDVETAGFAPPKGFLLEVGLAFVAEGKVVASTEHLVLPACRWQYHPLYLQSRKVHGIQPSEILAHGKPEAQVAADVHDLLTRFATKYGAPKFVAHSAGFEARWLTEEPWGLPFDVDTLPLAKERLPDLGDHKLATLVEHFGLAFDGNPHRARPDAVATAEVLLRLLEPAPRLPKGAAGQVPGGPLKPSPVLVADPGPPPPHSVESAYPAGEAMARAAKRRKAKAEPLPPVHDLTDFKRALHTWCPPLAAEIRRQVEMDATTFGEEADTLLDDTLSGVRALLLRAGHYAPEAEALLMEVAALLQRTPRRGRRKPAKPSTKVFRLFGRTPLEPVGAAKVGPATAPGHLYRLPSGELVALTHDHIARLEVADEPATV